MNKIEKAIMSNEPDEIENAVVNIYKESKNEFLIDADTINSLIELLGLDWHNQHENIVMLFQFTKEPKSIDILFETATKNFEYLSYDEFYGLARKCTWALADIGTSEAQGKLQLLAQNENEYISKYAKERLDNWEGEQKRKGNYAQKGKNI